MKILKLLISFSMLVSTFAYSMHRHPRFLRDDEIESEISNYQKQRTKIKNLKLLHTITKDPIQKTNLALKIAFSYYLKTQACNVDETPYLKKALQYLNIVINEEPEFDLNAEGLNYHMLSMGLFYYAFMHFEGTVIPRDLDKAIKLFCDIINLNNYEMYDTKEIEKIRRLAYLYLGKIFHEFYTIYAKKNYKSPGYFLYKSLKNDLLPEKLKKEAIILLAPYLQKEKDEVERDIEQIELEQKLLSQKKDLSAYDSCIIQ